MWALGITLQSNLFNIATWVPWVPEVFFFSRSVGGNKEILRFTPAAAGTSGEAARKTFLAWVTIQTVETAQEKPVAPWVQLRWVPKYLKLYYKLVRITQSVYDTKNIFCIFERPFKIQKNGVFRFEISFFRFRDIDVFLICKFDQWWCHNTATEKLCKLNKRYLWKY